MSRPSRRSEPSRIGRFAVRQSALISIGTLAPISPPLAVPVTGPLLPGFVQGFLLTMEPGPEPAGELSADIVGRGGPE